MRYLSLREPLVTQVCFINMISFSICPLLLSSYFLTISRIKSSFYCSQNASQETGNWDSLSCFLRLIYFKIDWRYLFLISYKPRWHSKAVFKHIPWQEGCLSSLDSPFQFYHWIISKEIPYSSFIQNFHNCCTLSKDFEIPFNPDFH